MNRQWNTEKRDLTFLKDVGSMQMGLVAEKHKITESAARQWLHRIRIRITRCQNYVNRIRTLQRNSPRIRKLTTDGSLPDQEEDTEILLVR